jgi:serine/threonine protein kinase
MELRVGPEDRVEFADWMDRLGRYQILDPIGSGPCGAVFRAKVYGVVGVDRQFAIKQILPALAAHPPHAQALSAAARAYGSLEHPRIARLAEFTVSQGKTFTATELVTGLDVGRVVAEGRVSSAALPPGGALTLLSAAARAVGFAHGRGLSHLGLCPQNLLISADGDIKVTDFGILAACLPEKPVQDPRLAHRVAYLAPEQLVGEPTSAATDVFALGAIAVEMVTGTPAFRGETPLDVQHAVLSGQLSDPSLPRPIVKVLQRCLARAPFERFPDARALADALDAALRSAPVPGSRQDISERVKAIMAHLAALNEGGLSGVVSLPSSVPQPPLPPSRPSRPPTVLGPEVIATPTSLPERDRLETAEFLRDESVDEDVADEELDEDDLSPHTVVQQMADSPSRGNRPNDAPMMAATLRGISAAHPPRPMPPSQLGQPLAGPALASAPPPLPPGRTGTIKVGVVPEAAAEAKSAGAPARASAPAIGGAPARASAPAIGPSSSPSVPQPPSLPSITGAAAGRSNASDRAGSAGDEVTRELRVPKPVNAARPSVDPAAPVTPHGGAEGEVTTARHRALAGNAWDEAMESFEQPTRLNESLTASLLPSTSRTGPSPLLELDELVLSSLSEPLAKAEAKDRPAEPAAPSPAASSSALDLALAAAEPVVPGLDDALFGAEETGDDARAEASAVAEAPSAEPAPASDGASDAVPVASEAPMRSSKNDLFRSSALVQVVESDSELLQAQVPRRPSDSPGQGMGLQVPPLRPSERALPRPGSYPHERSSSPSIERPGSWSGGSYGGGGSGPNVANPYGTPFGRPTLPPLPMGFPDENVPRLAGGGGRWLWMLLGVVIVLGSGVGAYAVFGGFSEPGSLAQPDAGQLAAVPTAEVAGDGGEARPTGDAGGAATPSTADAGGAVAAAGDAGATKPPAVDASAATTPAPVEPAPASGARPPEPADGLVITSEPSGARVYIDGADQGQTPLRLPSASDRHTAVLFLAGHDLATIEIDKSGAYTAQLKEITPLGGPGGIKVRCRVKDRYYVFIDGKPTGALCPTERLEVDRGEHQIEIYDLVSETRRQFRLNVKDISRSTRIRVD